MPESRGANAEPRRDATRLQGDSAAPSVPPVEGGVSRTPGPRSGNGQHRFRRQVPAAIVAGGAGFLGSHLCDRLIADGYRVYCVDSFYTGRMPNVEHLAGEPRFALMEHDVRSPLPSMPDVTEIYNLASPASPIHYQKDPVHTVTTNVVGTLNLVDLAARLGARFLHASTSEVYGDPEVHPQPESYRGCVSSTGPRACYDEGKRVAEAICYDFLRMKRADVRVTRIFNTYGPRMRADDGRIISNLITQALRGEPLTINGSGKQTRSFCYVSDLIEGMRRLMTIDRPPATPVNLGNPGEFTVLEVAEIVAQLTRSDMSVIYRPLPEDDPQRRRPDIELAAELLGWLPRIPLREGLKSTIDWFSRTLERPRAGIAAARAAKPKSPLLPVIGPALATRGADR